MSTSAVDLDLLPAALRAHAAARPDQPAVMAPDGTVWSWSTLDRRADAFAGRLAAAAGPSGRVGLAVRASADGIAAIHGVARSGVSTLLVNPRLTATEIGALLATAGTQRLVVEAGVEVEVPGGISSVSLGAAGAGQGRPSDAPETERRGEFIVATSGSTARPKLARLPLDRLAASAAAWDATLPPATGWLLSLGLSHVAGVGIVVRAAMAGVPIVIPAGTDPPALIDALVRAHTVAGVTVSHLSLVAAQLSALLDATRDAPPPAGLRAVILGGGPIPASSVRRAVRAGWPVVPSYGMTETASGLVALVGDEVGDAPGTVGRPLPGAELRLDGAEIHVRGAMLFAGYLDDDAATSAAVDADGWLRTGDLGRLDAAGRLVVLGRRDEVIVRGGENVAPAEVEAAIATHPGVAEVAVIGVDDRRWGQVPIAAVVPAPGASPTDAGLRAHVRTRLAGFKVPARFVILPELPRTSIGKVARPELRRRIIGTPSTRIVTTDDGQRLTVHEMGERDAPTVLLLHATLSTSEQLRPLARRLVDRARVVVVDRRGSGASVMAAPAPVPVERHAADVIAVLDGLDIDRAVLVGHSFGGVVALCAAVAAPDRVDGLLVWEPPFLVLAEPAIQRAMRAMTAHVQRQFASDGPEAAAHLFLDGVAGAGSWDRLRPRQREAIGREGAGVLADVAMDGLTADGLDAITCPTIVATGGASEPFYRPIAEALARLIGPSAAREDLPGLRHMAPITDPEAVAELIARLVPDPSPTARPTPQHPPAPTQETVR